MTKSLVCRDEQNIWILGLAVCIEPEALSCDRKNLYLAHMPDELTVFGPLEQMKKKMSS